MTLSTTVIEVQDLSKTYGHELKVGSKVFGRETKALSKVSFSVRKGEIFGFLGPNGAGKTTTIRAMLNYLTIDEGSILIKNLDYQQDYLEIRKTLGFLPGDVAFHNNFTGHELIDYLTRFRPIDKDFFNYLRSELCTVDLTKKIGTLSKGNRQQVAILLALASNPDIIVFDEATAGLDPLKIAKLHKLLKNLRNKGKTIFLSSHNLAEVQSICDRIAIIRNGEIVVVEEIKELMEKNLQRMIIEFESNLPPQDEFLQVDGVVEVEIIEKTVSLKFRTINPLIKFLGNYNIKRMNVEDISLEEIFLEYYEVSKQEDL